jgi:hypothetical protein
MPAIMRAGNHFTVPTARNPAPPKPVVDWSEIAGIRPRKKPVKVKVTFAVPKPVKSYVGMRCVYEAFKIDPIKGPMLSVILDVVAKVWGVSKADILSERRNKSIVVARQAVCFLARHHTSRSLSDIGRFLNRDHQTVFHSVRVFEKRDNDEIRKLLDRCAAMLRECA